MSTNQKITLALMGAVFATRFFDVAQADTFKTYAATNAAKSNYMIEVFTRQAEWCEEALETGKPTLADRELIAKYPRDRPVEPDPELLALSTEQAEQRSIELRATRAKARKRFYACFKEYRQEFPE